MSSTHELLEIIAALKRRLEQAQARAAEAISAAPAGEGPDLSQEIQRLRDQLAAGAVGQEMVQVTLHQAAPPPAGDGAPELPPHLTARALRLVRQARERLDRLRAVHG